jgi:hypothetical protein
MAQIGFSTGALAKGDFLKGIEISRALGCSAIELSALRLSELEPLVAFAEDAEFRDFAHVSIHAPSRLDASLEKHVVALLLGLSTRRRWPVVLHPDCITEFSYWEPFEELLYIENMDKRKPHGRTLEELDIVFSRLPNARMCFDIAHARQVDSTMTEAYRILSRFSSRVRQLHVSEVNSRSGHERVSDAALRAYAQVLDIIPKDVPLILEALISPSDAVTEIARVSSFIDSRWTDHASTLS